MDSYFLKAKKLKSRPLAVCKCLLSELELLLSNLDYSVKLKYFLSESCASGYYIELCAEDRDSQRKLNKRVLKEFDESKVIEIQSLVISTYSLLLCPFAPCFPGGCDCYVLEEQVALGEDVVDHRGTSWPHVEQSELNCSSDSSSDEEDS